MSRSRRARSSSASTPTPTSPCGPAPARAAPRCRRRGRAALVVERAGQRLDQPVDRQGVPGRAQRGADVPRRGRAGPRTPPRRPAVRRPGVAAQQLLEQVARLGRIEQVGGDGGVERQAAHVDADRQQRAHERPWPGAWPRGRPPASAGRTSAASARRTAASASRPAGSQATAPRGIGDEGQALERRRPSLPSQAAATASGSAPAAAAAPAGAGASSAARASAAVATR